MIWFFISCLLWSDLVRICYFVVDQLNNAFNRGFVFIFLVSFAFIVSSSSYAQECCILFNFPYCSASMVY
ncbi:hypothetical protein DsansV1_C10g0098921 [Dioscorea sansibarensis]